jgi:hypothetical protein
MEKDRETACLVRMVWLVIEVEFGFLAGMQPASRPRRRNLFKRLDRQIPEHSLLRPVQSAGSAELD